MALRLSLSFFLAFSALVPVSSVPIAMPIPASLGVSTTAPASIALRDASPSPTFPDIANNVGNSVSGNAGTAEGGSVINSLPLQGVGAGLLGLNNLHLLSVGSHNAGDAGVADSGVAIPESNAHVDVKYPVPVKGQFKSSRKKFAVPRISNSVDNANSGSGGNANGGSTGSSGSLIDLFSDNGGKGGGARSGASGAGLAGLPLLGGRAANTYNRPRSIAFRKHAINKKSRLSRMAHPYR